MIWFHHFSIWILCLAGTGLSLVGLSGTWLIVGAAILAAWLPGAASPGLWTIAAFAALALALEVLDWLAGVWGVQKRGGSGLGALMALIGAIAGFFLGSFIPIPLVGNLVGMLLGSFLLVFLVERSRLRHGGQAAHIALGAVLARLYMVLVKTGVALGMSFWLLWKLYW